MRRIERGVVVLSVVLCFGLMAKVAGAQAATVTGPSLAQAQQALAASEKVANEMGVGLTCAVVDSRGALVALFRMDGASYFTSDVAVGKARASAAFRAPSAPWPASASLVSPTCSKEARCCSFRELFPS